VEATERAESLYWRAVPAHMGRRYYIALVWWWLHAHCARIVCSLRLRAHGLARMARVAVAAGSLLLLRELHKTDAAQCTMSVYITCDV
jgi:hypothetical protein